MGTLGTFWQEVLWTMRTWILVTLLNYNHSSGKTYSSENSVDATSTGQASLGTFLSYLLLYLSSVSLSVSHKLQTISYKGCQVRWGEEDEPDWCNDGDMGAEVKRENMESQANFAGQLWVFLNTCVGSPDIWFLFRFNVPYARPPL